MGNAEWRDCREVLEEVAVGQSSWQSGAAAAASGRKWKGRVLGQRGEQVLAAAGAQDS